MDAQDAASLAREVAWLPPDAGRAARARRRTLRRAAAAVAGAWRALRRSRA